MNGALRIIDSISHLEDEYNSRPTDEGNDCTHEGS